jgi:hypothetical protein
MAAKTKQGNRQTGAGGATHKGSGPNVGERAQRAMGDARDRATQYMEQGNDRLRELTQDHEGTAVLVALGAGFAVGLLIGGAIAASQSRPQRMSERLAAEGVGRRLLERVESMLPDVLTERLERLGR